MAIDSNLDALLAADPEALAWLVLLAYGSGYDAADGLGLTTIRDERVAALVAGAAEVWRRHQRIRHAPRTWRPSWLQAMIDQPAGVELVEPWTEDTI